jgi:regulator of CtrA degradation
MAGKDKQQSGKGSGVFLLPGIYNETLALLVDAHDYFYRQAPREQMQLDNRERIMFTSEMSRVTIRLSCVMAWLMARKAAFEGKITAEEANEHYKLDCREICMNQFIEAESLLPERMNDLLDKSLELYLRVARLEELTNRDQPQ